MAPTSDTWPKLLPAYRNLAWNIPATFTDETPLLAILELKTRSNIDLLEHGTPYNNLLQKALEYCHSLPETKIHYGNVRDESTVIILVELPSASVWQDFNKSAFLDLLRSTFDCNPNVHCLPWRMPLDISGDVELLTVHFGTAAETFFGNKRFQFGETWGNFSKAVTETERCGVHGD